MSKTWTKKGSCQI